MKNKLKTHDSEDIKAILGKSEADVEVEEDKALFESKKRYISKYTAVRVLAYFVFPNCHCAKLTL